MSTSPEIQSYIDRYDIQHEIIALGLDLLVNGPEGLKCTKHSVIKDAGYYAFRLDPHSDSKKGRARIIDHSKFKEPSVTSEAAKYCEKKYIGKSIRIHPDLKKVVIDIHENKYTGGSFNVLVLVIKGRGVISWFG